MSRSWPQAQIGAWIRDGLDSVRDNVAVAVALDAQT
jgi:hypothetical protein